MPTNDWCAPTLESSSPWPPSTASTTWELLRSAKSDYYTQPHLPQVAPVGDRVAAYAGRR